MKKKLLFVLAASLLLIGCVFAASKKSAKGTDTSVVQEIALDKLEHRTNDDAAPIVYFTRDIIFFEFKTTGNWNCHGTFFIKQIKIGNF